MSIRYGSKIRCKTYLGTFRTGIVREILADGSYMVEIDEQLIPDLGFDILIQGKKGRTFTIFKQRFPNWQAWVKPEWVLGIVPHEKRIDVV